MMICRRRAANTIGHLVPLVCWLPLVPKAAVEVLRQASHFSPQDANVYQALARAFQALGKSEEAEKAFALSSRLRSEDLEASQLLHLCRQQLEARDLGKAIETGQRLCR